MDVGFTPASDPQPLKRPLEANAATITPGPAKKKVSFGPGVTPGAPQTPEDHKPAPTPSTATKYKDRSNGGATVEVANKHLTRRAAWGELGSVTSRAVVVAAPSEADVDAWTSSKAFGGQGSQQQAVGTATRYRHMFTPPGERCAALDASLSDAAQKIRDAFTTKDVEPCAIGTATQTPALFCGRVCLDALDGRLNKASVCLEGERSEGGFRVPLDLSATEGSYALFPGQVIGVVGSAPGEDGTILARSIILGSPAPPAASPSPKLQEYHTKQQNNQPLSIWVASGPYTTSDDLDYAPLKDLLAACRKAKPDAVVLLGPFVDADHPAAKANDLKEGDEVVDAATLFVLKVAWALEKLVESEDCPTQFILAPATRDLVAEPVFPQPPLTAPPLGAKNDTRPSWQDEFPMSSLELPSQVHVVGNPGLFKVNEVVIGVTATDVLFLLSSQELFHNGRDNAPITQMPRVARLASHLLSQRSFYPLFPPPAMSSTVADAPVDLRQHAKWALPLQPDVLITPSRLQPFARDVQGCLVLNPGHLARGQGGGTFSQLTVHPLAEGGEGDVAHGVPARTRAEITRI
jgi:DNA polymerase alpha subunit B